MKIRQIAGDNIRFIRQKRKLSQIALAVEANMSTSYIGYVERGEKSITIDRLEKIAKALEVTPAFLLTPNAHQSL